jgi:hypothetical protein
VNPINPIAAYIADRNACFTLTLNARQMKNRMIDMMIGDPKV